MLVAGRRIVRGADSPVVRSDGSCTGVVIAAATDTAAKCRIDDLVLCAAAR